MQFYEFLDIGLFIQTTSLQKLISTYSNMQTDGYCIDKKRVN